VDLAERLLDLAATVDDLPAAEREAVARALRRFERDRWIRLAARHAGGCAGLLEALGRDGWRLEIWLRRGKVPSTASPLQVCLFNALETSDGELPGPRHLRRLCRGHAMSDDCAFTDS
jgi:hypothetical protein